MSTETPAVQKSASEILAEVLLRREAKEEAKKQQDETVYAEKDARRRKQDAQQQANDQRRFANCDHLCGNHKNGEEPMKWTPNLSHHTFQSGIERIRCNKCGFRWFRGDMQETIKRNG